MDFNVRASDAAIVPPALSPTTPIFAVWSTPISDQKQVDDEQQSSSTAVPYDALFWMICFATSDASSSQIGYLCSGARRYSTEIQIVFVALDIGREVQKQRSSGWTYSANRLTLA